jgi:integrase
MSQTRVKKERKRSYTTNEDGSRSIPLSPEAAEIFKEQERKFREKFGRAPGPDDPIFFDESADTPRFDGQKKIDEHTQAMTDAMTLAGTPPHLIYAFRKTGRIVSERNMQFLTDEELQEWNDAVDEFYEKEKKQRA